MYAAGKQHPGVGARKGDAPGSTGKTRTLDSKLRSRLQTVLSVVDDHGTRGPRLLDDGMRLWGRCRKFLKMNLIPEITETDALELACMALQLPMRIGKPTSKRRARPNLRDRSEEAAELLVERIKDDVDED